jgi:glucose-1-phosphate cytidylyltransferase
VSPSKGIPIIILCGGQGTRIRDVSDHVPKPMLPIGGLPILWHIMRIYAWHGYTNFVLALGYKSWIIKEYFLNYRAMTSDFRLKAGKNAEIHFFDDGVTQDWTITFAETGEDSQTGQRVLLCERYVDGPEFMVTYGDGVADIDIGQLHHFHRGHGKEATVTGVRPTGRFGAVSVEGTTVTEFTEKKQAGGGLINGGFFVFQRSFFDVLRKAGNTMLESTPLYELVDRRQLQMYCHEGFWEPMDTMREYLLLNKLWADGKAPWRIWP